MNVDVFYRKLDMEGKSIYEGERISFNFQMLENLWLEFQNVIEITRSYFQYVEYLVKLL